MANIKTRIDSLWDTYRATRPPSVVCVNKSGERTKVRWFDALRAAIQQDENIVRFEDTPEFKGVQQLPECATGCAERKRGQKINDLR